MDHPINEDDFESYTDDLRAQFRESPDDEDSILRYHHVPHFSIGPIKPEDQEEKGVRVEFRIKRWVCPTVRSYVSGAADLFRLLVEPLEKRRNAGKK